MINKIEPVMNVQTSLKQKDHNVLPKNENLKVDMNNVRIATDLEKLIMKEAAKWLDVREIGKNQSFNNKEFEKLIRKYGWISGWAWCASFTILVWKEVFKIELPSLMPQLNKYMNHGVIRMNNSFRKSREFRTSPNIPRPGAIMIMQSRKNSALGHAGIVTSFLKNGKFFDTIEGNTGASGLRDGDPRGDGVAEKTRNLGINGGLSVIRFIYPDPLPEGDKIRGFA